MIDAKPDGSMERTSLELEADRTMELLERARTGDRHALDELVARYLPRLRRWARGRLPQWARDLADTDDLVQDTLLRTLKGLGDFESRGEGALQAYLRQSILNRIRDQVRRAGRRPTQELDPREPVKDPTPLEEAIGQETLERYERALGQLRDEDREAIVVRVELGGTYDEVAVALRKPSTDAARMAVGRALVRLAEAMGRAG